MYIFAYIYQIVGNLITFFSLCSTLSFAAVLTFYVVLKNIKIL